MALNQKICKRFSIGGLSFIEVHKKLSRGGRLTKFDYARYLKTAIYKDFTPKPNGK